MLNIGPSRDIAACQALRHAVFIEEQGVPFEIERDGRDDVAHHMLATLDDQPTGTARVLIAGDTGRIGRVCVLANARGQGIGTGLVRAAVAHLRTLPDLHRAVLGAQTHALDFYQRLGFSAFGPVYADAGNVPHRDMELIL